MAAAGLVMEMLMYRDNAATLTIDPLYSLFYDTHPSANLRIAALQPRLKKK